MKIAKTQMLVVFMMLMGCHNNDSKTSATGTQNSDTTYHHSSGPQILVTEFAQWAGVNGEPVSGEYDAEKGSFIPCGTDKVLPIPANEIKIIPDGNCDGTPREMNKEILVVQTDTNKVISREINVDTVKMEATYKVNGMVLKFHLNDSSMKRLRSEPKLTRSILRR